MEVEDVGFRRALEALDMFFSQPGTLAPPHSNIHLTAHLLKVLDLEQPLSKLSVIHVAGTKGKGSTCAFVERILRASGLKTGFFSSPHLLDIRERFRLNGTQVSKKLFADCFWWCWERTQTNPGECFEHGVPMARLSRFLTVLAFKIFIDEKVDVAIVEVGLGGRYDATNVIKSPVICGITSLGYDHMEVLGNTLDEIATEKAGIFKEGVPAITVAQPAEAMQALERRAKELNISLRVASSLESYGLGGVELGLNGEHQLINAALAVALCKGWAERSGHKALCNHNMDAYNTGLSEARWPGRAQIIRVRNSNLVFFIDGAHSPESMEVCGKWFATASRVDPPTAPTLKVLLFNCMPKRDPRLLLPPLRQACARERSAIQLALFVPPYSSSDTVSHSVIDKPDLSWQETLQQEWEALEDRVNSKPLLTLLNGDFPSPAAAGVAPSSAVMPSLPAAFDWLVLLSRKHPCLHLQVLVTGSLYLVADVLRLLNTSCL